MSQSHNDNPNPASLKLHAGGCHCGQVRFEAELDLSAGASRCNCSLCTMVAQTGVIVKPAAFTLLAGADALSEYRVGNSPNARYFCKRCGIQTFGKGNVPQIGGDFVSINVNCLDDVEPSAVPVVHFDGRHDNWMAGPRRESWPVRA
jgi:hypothetical protein